MLKKMIDFALFFSVFQLSAQSQKKIQIAPSLAFLVEYKKSATSGMMIADSNVIFLVTSKHGIIGQNKTAKFLDIFLNTDSITISGYFDKNSLSPVVYGINLKIANQINFVNVHPYADVITIPIGKLKNDYLFLFNSYVTKIDSTESLFPPMYASNKFLSYKNLDWGSEVGVVGFPKSLGLEEGHQYNFNRPLLRKGIVAGVDLENQTIIIDCPTYGGNSGGPVLATVEYGDEMRGGTTFNIIGIVSEFIPSKEDWINEKYRYRNTYLYNSGYSVITPSDFIIELLKEYKRNQPYIYDIGQIPAQ